METPIPVTGNLLIIDDKPANLRLLTDMLTKRGHMVRPVPSGELGLRAAHVERPDLVLLDIKMPEMDGFEVCRRFKKTASLKNVPIIFISAHSETEDKVRAFRMGAVDYVAKPFQVEEVLARVEAHLVIRHLFEENHRYQKSLEAEVERRTRQAEEANEKLRQVTHAVEMGTLISGILHELKNALFPLSGTAEMLVEELERLHRFHLENGWEARPAGYSERVERMAAMAGRLEPYTQKLERFAETMLAASRNVRVEPTPQSFDMRRYVEDLENLVRVWSKRGTVRKAIVIEKIIPESPVVAFADPEHFFQIAANLVKNAADAIETTGTITLEAKLNGGGHAEFSVRDDGPGIPRNKIPHIFESFFTTKAAAVGTGLGLPICRELVDKNYGRLFIETNPGKGARFRVLLPKKMPPGLAAETEIIPAEAPHPAASEN
jgi:signal transduction histidine kinase